MPVGAVLVLGVALALRAPLLGGGQIDFDEGVYWQSLRALAAGGALFAEVYSSQPPAFRYGWIWRLTPSSTSHHRKMARMALATARSQLRPR